MLIYDKVMINVINAKPLNNEDLVAFNNVISNELIPAMKIDMIKAKKKGWWKFWK